MTAAPVHAGAQPRRRSIVRDWAPLAAARCALAAALLVGAPLASLAAEAAFTGLTVRASEPRAFGHQVGDRVERTVEVDVPAGLVLDVHSLPEPGPLTPVLELRGLDRSEQAIAGGSRLRLTLRYQWFASPPAPRVYELPTLRLRFSGRAGDASVREQDARVEAWPVVIGPLMPEAVSPRDGLGELRPDTAPVAADASAARRALVASLGVALLPALWLLSDATGWLRRRPRGPFDAAWRALKAVRPAAEGPAQTEAWRSHARALHAALNAAAGQVVRAATLDAALDAVPHLQPLRADWQRFLALSDQAFFAAPASPAWLNLPGGPGSEPLASPRGLLALARACRDAERRVR